MFNFFKLNCVLFEFLENISNKLETYSSLLIDERLITNEFIERIHQNKEANNSNGLLNKLNNSNNSNTRHSNSN